MINASFELKNENDDVLRKISCGKCKYLFYDLTKLAKSLAK